MKKRILAAFVCAAMVLSLAGCASDAEKNALANIASNAANQTSKPTSSAATSKADATSGAATNSTATSKPATSSGDTTSSAVSSTTSNTSKPKDNLADWNYSTYNDNGETVIRINGYKGTDEKVEIPAEINGLKVTVISSGAFRNNIDITSITIPESVTIIGDSAFDQCLNLSEITFKGSAPTLDNNYDPMSVFNGTPWLEAKKAENSNFFIIGDVLYRGLECEGDITIPSGVKKIGDRAFNTNKNITSVTIPDGVTEIGAYAFQECTGLISVTIPDSVTVIGDGAFYYCTSLQSANIPQNIVTLGERAFVNCNKFVGRFTLPDSIRTFGDYYYPFNANNIELEYKGTTYKGSSGYNELRKAIQQNAIAEEFGDNDFVITDNVLMKVKPGVTKIELPDTVKGIDAKAFDGCDQSIIISFKGKNYNLANLDKLKEAVTAN